MRCDEDDTCKFIIPGTERYHPRNKQFDRLYWDEYVAYEEHQMTHHGQCRESELLEWARLKVGRPFQSAPMTC